MNNQPHMLEQVECLCGAIYARKKILTHNCACRGSFKVPKGYYRDCNSVALALFRAGHREVEFRNGFSQIWGIDKAPLDEIQTLIKERIHVGQLINSLEQTDNSALIGSAKHTLDALVTRIVREIAVDKRKVTVFPTEALLEELIPTIQALEALEDLKKHTDIGSTQSKINGPAVRSLNSEYRNIFNQAIMISRRAAENVSEICEGKNE